MIANGMFMIRVSGVLSDSSRAKAQVAMTLASVLIKLATVVFIESDGD